MVPLKKVNGGKTVAGIRSGDVDNRNEEEREGEERGNVGVVGVVGAVGEVRGMVSQMMVSRLPGTRCWRKEVERDRHTGSRIATGGRKERLFLVFGDRVAGDWLITDLWFSAVTR